MTSNHNNNMANAMSGKTARACDCCVRRRARWYCAADDAFLCQSCDSSVHSANPLARRHERVRLKTASLKQSDNLPTWHRGLTRKPRTPRHGKNSSSSNKSSNTHNNNNMMGQQNPLHMVPDLGVEETTSFSSSHGEDEEQLLFRVPIYDPFVSELCTSTTNTPTLDVKNDHHHHQFMIKSPPDGYLPSDLDLEEFAADVETLLGKGLDDESYGIEELGLLDYSPTSNNNNHISINDDDDDEKVVKEENEFLLGDHINSNNNNNNVELIKKCEMDIIENDDVGFRVPFELSFDYDTDFPTTCEEQDGYDHNHHHHGLLMMVDDSSVVVDEIINDDSNRGLCKVEEEEEEEEEDKESNEVLINKRRKILLRLDYDAISTAWANQGSPWINGQRPQINQDDCWPHCMGACGTGVHHALFGDVPTGGTGGHCRVGDGGREARVSRYREKRRTRLFSKKIRYEVRKLNAEKRPRMKGRFVKRSSFAPTTTSFPLVSKK